METIADSVQSYSEQPWEIFTGRCTNLWPQKECILPLVKGETGVCVCVCELLATFNDMLLLQVNDPMALELLYADVSNFIIH